jgi:RNA polymerase sigma-70 factor (ECF subfamily)
LNVSRHRAHDKAEAMSATAQTEPRPAALMPRAADAESDFRALYDGWFAQVCRWLRALGGPQSDVEDLAQEVFLVVRRKLHAFDGESAAAWLYGISARVAANARRAAWFRHLFSRRGPLPDGEPSRHAGPAELLERKQAEAALYRLLDRMSEKRRTVLVLSEIEGHSGDEIARLLRIPVATVRTRLHHARRDLVALAAKRRPGDEP